MKSNKTPWIRNDGGIDFKQIPIEAALHNVIDGNNDELRGRCGALAFMYTEGKKEAAIFLYGLMAHNYNDIVRKEIIVKSFKDIETKEAAEILFRELNSIDSNNTTRKYIDEILKVLKNYPTELIKDRLELLMRDKKWSIRMKRKFEEVLIYNKHSV